MHFLGTPVLHRLLPFGESSDLIVESKLTHGTTNTCILESERLLSA
jgi:hypothetical protein